MIVRRNRAEKNVAGIEIENTIGADVYENTATGNTGGILVFNMPNLAQPGHSTRVFKNTSIDNNLANFAAKGAAVASVPAGSGVVVNSNPKVEIFDNDIAGNKTANLIISSYYSTNYYNTKGVDPKYDPYPRSIFVYGNRFKGGGDSPDGMELKTLKVAMFGINGHFPDVLWDGYLDAATLVNGMPPAGRTHLRAEWRHRSSERRWSAQVQKSQGRKDFLSMRAAQARGDRFTAQLKGQCGARSAPAGYCVFVLASARSRSSPALARRTLCISFPRADLPN